MNPLDTIRQEVEDIMYGRSIKCSSAHNMDDACPSTIEALLALIRSSRIEGAREVVKAMEVQTAKDKGDEEVDPNPSDAFQQGKRECFEAARAAYAEPGEE